MSTELERLSDTLKLSAHVTRVLGQNPSLMTLQGTNSYLLQPPSNPLAPIILIDTSSPHTAQQYVDLLLAHLHHLALGPGTRETHFESSYAQSGLKNLTEEEQEKAKAAIIAARLDDRKHNEIDLVEYGSYGQWEPNATKERTLPPIEHIILTHRHLDHVGALPLLLTTLKDHGLPPPKLWKLASPDEASLVLDERDRLTSDAALWEKLPRGAYTPLSPLQPFHPIMPGLMISILDPSYRHLLKHDVNGKPKWTEVPEVARVSVRCLRTPGHTADSISLVMCEGEKGVFTGDTVLGQGTTVFTDFGSYMLSLKTLLALKPSVIYPAHGPSIVGAEACHAHIAGYISHRQEREDAIVAILRGLADQPGSLGAKIEVIRRAKVVEAYEKMQYELDFHGEDRRPDQTPEAIAQDDITDAFPTADAAGVAPRAISIPLLCRIVYNTGSENLIAAASKSALAHLVKLENERKVRRVRAKLPRVIDWAVEENVETDAWELV